MQHRKGGRCLREETHRFRTRKPAFLCGITHSTARSVGRPNMTVYTAVLTVHTAAPALRRPGGVIGEVRHRLSLACDCTFTAFPWPVTAFSPPFLGPVTALPTPFLGLGLHFHRLSLPIHRLSLACDCTSTAFPRLSTAFPPPFPVTFHCLFQYFQVITYSTCHCLFLTFRCLSSTFHQPSSTFHCLSSAFHCLSSTFHCLSSTFHCLSSTFVHLSTAPARSAPGSSWPSQATAPPSRRRDCHVCWHPLPTE